MAAITPEQCAFVMASFAANYRRHSGIAADAVYRRFVLEPFEAALPRLDVRVMTVPGAPDDFIGWRASRGEALFYVYVKKDFRRRGFGRALLPPAVTALVFSTVDGARLLAANGMRARPRPWAALDLLAETPDNGEKPWG